jgi:hypothetical protein
MICSSLASQPGKYIPAQSIVSVVVADRSEQEIL